MAIFNSDVKLPEGTFQGDSITVLAPFGTQMYSSGPKTRPMDWGVFCCQNIDILRQKIPAKSIKIRNKKLANFAKSRVEIH
jgi:nitrous oxidase accessory protein NosD